MIKKYKIFLIAFILILIIDQGIKQIFLNGFRWEGEYFSLILTFNKGVAFSMFAFLGEWLKYIQVGLILGLFIFFYKEKTIFKDHYLAIGIFLGAGCSNLLDRFIQVGVVDYVYWHKWFEFAIFNFADVMIDLAVVLVLLKTFIWKGEKECKEISI